MDTVNEHELRSEHTTKVKTSLVSGVHISNHQDTPRCSVEPLQINDTKNRWCIRVKHSANVDEPLELVDELWELMAEEWELDKPHLSISVTGGVASDSREEDRINRRMPALKAFHKGLVETAQSTGAWIITDETNSYYGVMKLVGDAIRAHTLKKGNRKPLVTIGIATWRCMTKKESNKDEAGQTETVLSSLDPNNTHFILVDDGTQYQLRAALEKKISTIETWGVKIPVVCIVVEGGPNAIEAVRQAIKAKTPIIVVEGSGSAADLLAYAYKHYTEPNENAQEQQSAKESNQRLWKDLEPRIAFTCAGFIYNRKNILPDIKFILKHRNMITIFPLEDKDSSGSIADAIIMTLLRVKRDETSTLDKVTLALAWNRIDVVKEHIYTGDAKLTEDELKDLAFRAVAYNRVDFVKFFLEIGLRLGELLKKYNTIKFYAKTIKKNRHLKHSVTVERSWSRDNWKVKRQDFEIVERLLKKLVNNLFDPTKLRVTKKLPSITGESAEATDVAAMELFFLAILCRRQQMAVLFLFEANETFALSLIGQLMLQNLLEMENDSDSKQELQIQVNFFKDLATGLLTECYSSSKEMSIDLLVRRIRAFANLTALEIAVQANNGSVIAHQSCQDLLTDIWMRRIIDDNQFYTKLLRIPPLFLFAPLLVQFNEEPSEGQGTKYSAAVQKNQVSPTREAPSYEVQCPSYFKRLWYFLTAPCVKFSISCVSYAVFLLLYSLILLTNFYPKISSAEMVLIAWIFTLLCEEIRQIAESRKLYNHLSSEWNWIDLIAILTFVLGLVLRLIQTSSCNKCFYAARIILALSLMIFYFRILYMFSIFRQLGPKLVMIGKMIIDLFYFMNILLVFIIAYGIAANVILYPNQELKLSLVRDVLSGAWWSVYGEFNIDEVSGESCVPLATQTSSAEDCASMDHADFNRTLCPGKDEKCPVIGWFGPIFLAIYALVTNVLMINLLIAMFSNTFAKVEQTADVIWKIQRYHFFLEYDSLPFLPPPLIILVHAFRLISLIIQSLKRKEIHDDTDADAKQVVGIKQPARSSTRAFRMGFGNYYERNLLAWLKVNVEEYLLKKKTNDAEGDRLVKETNARFDQLYQRIDESYRRIDESFRRIDESYRRIDESFRRIDESDQARKSFEHEVKELIRRMRHE